MEDPTLVRRPGSDDQPALHGGPDELDNGGVHVNSGVNNKAAFLITDGGTFNGQTVTGIGHRQGRRGSTTRSQTTLLTSASDYADLATRCSRPARTSIGTAASPPANCAEVQGRRRRRDERWTRRRRGARGPGLPGRSVADRRVRDDLEDPASGNWVPHTESGANGWRPPEPDPTTRPAAPTTSGGRTSDYDADYSMAMAGIVRAGRGTPLRFHHAYGFEDDRRHLRRRGRESEYQGRRRGMDRRRSCWPTTATTARSRADSTTRLRAGRLRQREQRLLSRRRLDLSSLPAGTCASGSASARTARSGTTAGSSTTSRSTRARPAPAPPDGDGDGVPDASDACPRSRPTRTAARPPGPTRRPGPAARTADGPDPTGGRHPRRRRGWARASSRVAGGRHACAARCAAAAR